MERLTARTPEGLPYYPKCFERCNGNPGDACWECKEEAEIVKRLAAYEDTGLSPEEIVQMGMMFADSKRYSGRLELKLKPYLDIGLSPAELNALKLASMGKCIAEIKEFDGIAIDRLRELAQADKERRLIVPPCKPGDTIWWADRNFHETPVQEIVL